MIDLRRAAVPAVPFAVSLLLSLAALGGTVGWQDSGFYLVAAAEPALLYPPGFVLWTVLAHAWTRVFFFLETAVAVHLFSALCAAAACGVLALAARAWLSARGPVFRVLPEEPGARGDFAAATAGVLAAAGFTMASSGVLAKVYALYFLVLALLLWRMIVAAETGRARELSVVAVLIGLAWQAHPAATTAGLALLLFVGVHARGLGAGGVAWRAGLAALVAAGPSLVGLPWLASRESTASFGKPDGPGEILAYMAGARFLGGENVFTLELSRILGTARYFWEEFLAVGTAAVVGGAVVLGRVRPGLLAALGLWVVPGTAVTVLFAMEGQHDFWLVGAWLPLWPLAAVGLERLGARAPRLVPAAGAAGLIWAVAANLPDMSQRGYGLAETYARLHLEPLDRGAILVTASDDASGGVMYLQRVKGLRPDVIHARWSRLEEGWYDRALMRAHPELTLPDYEGMRRAHPREAGAALAAFVNANAAPGRPVYLEAAPNGRLLREDLEARVEGGLFKVVTRGTPPRPPPEYGLEPEAVLAQERRARGQRVSLDVSRPRIRVAPEAYERRLARFLLRARVMEADRRMRGRTPEDLRAAADLLASVLRLDPGSAEAPTVIRMYGACLMGLGRREAAETAFRSALDLDLPPAERAGTLWNLGRLLQETGRAEEGRRLREEALRVPGLDEATRKELETRP